MGKKKRARQAKARAKNKGVFYRPGDTVEIRLWKYSHGEFIGEQGPWEKATILRVTGSKIDVRVHSTGKKHANICWGFGSFDCLRPAPAVEQLGDLVRDTRRPAPETTPGSRSVGLLRTTARRRRPPSRRRDTGRR